MSEASRVEWVKIAAVVGTTWAAFQVLSTMPLGVLASKFFPSGAAWVAPLVLAVWYLLAGLAAGIASALVIRSVPGGMPAVLVGALVGMFAFIQYKFTGSSAGQAGEQAIRVVCAGLSAAVLFAVVFHRRNRPAA